MTGSLATTGSNTFIGTQTITGSLFISSNLIVQGTSSLQNITASAVSIGTNLINLNTANPAIRYAGLVIGDSGSVGGSGSFLYDSVQDEFIFVHRGDSSVVTSSVTLMGPETYDNVGNETYPTLNIIQKGTGKEHLVDSCIFDNGTTTCIKNNLVGTGTACFGSTILTSDSLLIGTNSTATGAKVYACNNAAVIFRAESTEDQAGLRLIAGCTSLNRASRIDFLNGATSRTTPQWTIINDYNQNGTNDLSIVSCDPSVRPFKMFQSGIACFSGQICTPTLIATCNVGINEASPSALLHFSKQTNWGTSDNRVININNTGTGGDINQPHNMGSITWYSGNSTPTAEIAAYRNTPASGNNIELRFYTANVGTVLERMRIMSTGCVGIGNTSPNTILHTTIPTCWATNGTVVNSYPVATFSQCDCSGGARGLQIGVPTGGVSSPVFLKVTNTGARFSILDESNNENFTISGGKIGIGNIAPDTYLHICKNLTDVGLYLESTCKGSNASYIRLIGVNSNSCRTQMQIVHRGNHSSAGYADRIDFSMNNGTSWCESVMRFDFSGNVAMCNGSLSIANQISIGGTGTAASKGYKKFYSFGSNFDNPTVNLITVGNPTNAVTVLKVTVYTTGFGSNTANIHTGYAMKSWTASYACPMSIVSAFGNNNVGTLAWSGENLTYTTNRISNYDSYHVEVDYGGSNGSMSATFA
jgi:hypothetical protein